MKTIHKAQLFINDEQKIPLPKGSTPLRVEEQEGRLYLWFQTDTSVRELQVLHLYIHGTGHEILNDKAQYLNTVFLAGGLVFHIYTHFPQ